MILVFEATKIALFSDYFSSLCNYPKRYLFVGRKSSDFTDEIPDELVVVGLFALVLGRPFLQFIGSGLMTFIQTGADFVFWRHSVKEKKDKRLFFPLNFMSKLNICIRDGSGYPKSAGKLV